MVSARVIPGTKQSAQARPCVKMATAATVPNMRPSPICPVLAKRAKHSALTNIVKTIKWSVITRALDSCASGDAPPTTCSITTNSNSTANAAIPSPLPIAYADRLSIQPT